MMCAWLLHRVNMGRPREIPRDVREKGAKMYVHLSVKTRMEAEGLDDGKYVPKMKFESYDVEWVD